MRKKISISRVVGYVRVSTENQLENYSIDEQSQRIRAYCAAKGWALCSIYTDGGYSGGNTNRPALQQMLELVRAGGVDAVVVYKLDRLSRSQKDTLSLIEDEFLMHGVDFISINENFDTSTPFGRAMIGILSVFAQLEKDQITERMIMGRIGRCKAGYFHGGGDPPFGYRYKDNLLHVNEYEAMQVRDVYRRFLNGESINAICNRMPIEYGGKWTATKVRNILKNCIYIGKVKMYGEVYDGQHEPLVDVDTYEAANRLLTSPERTNQFTAPQKTPFRAGALLSGLLYCARCGARYSLNHGKYRCYSRAKPCKKFIVDPNCKNDHWEQEELDAYVVDSIHALLGNEAMMAGIIEDARQKAAPKMDTRSARRRIDEIDKQISKLVELYQISEIPMADIKSRTDKLAQEKRILTDALEQAETIGTDREQSFRDTVARFEKEFDGAPLETKRLLVSSVIESIQLDGKDAKISWRI